MANRAEEIFRNVQTQTKDYQDQLPEEVQCSIRRIEQWAPPILTSITHSQVLIRSRIFQDIINFLKQLQEQGFVKRYARQDENKRQISQFSELLDKAMLEFSVSW